MYTVTIKTISNSHTTRFFMLTSMSSHASSISHILNSDCNLVNDGATSNISSAYRTMKARFDAQTADGWQCH